MKYALILFALTAISCNKEYSCDCVYPNGQVYSQPFKPNVSKRSAQKNCDVKREQFKSVNAVCRLVAN